MLAPADRRVGTLPPYVAPVLLVLALASPGLWYELSQARMVAEPGRAAAQDHAPVPAAPRPDQPSPERGPPAVEVPPAPEEHYVCRMPSVRVEGTEGCRAGLPYPDCKWRVPDPRSAHNLYAIWRNTTDQRRSGRPALVSLILTVAAEYARRYPGEILAIGDLDAEGPRHETHRNGQDVDLYLPGMMEVENLGGGEYEDNYAKLFPLSQRMIRARVEELARILAVCTNGALRIYYNDPPVIERFQRWYDERGYSSPFGQPMQSHNDLHRFHFHVTVPEDMEPLPLAEP